MNIEKKHKVLIKKLLFNYLKLAIPKKLVNKKKPKEKVVYLGLNVKLL